VEQAALGAEKEKIIHRLYFHSLDVINVNVIRHVLANNETARDIDEKTLSVNTVNTVLHPEFNVFSNRR
jgi:hypothetical protein